MNLSVFKTIAATAMACVVGVGGAWSFGGLEQAPEPQAIAQAAPPANQKASGAGEKTKPDIERLQGTWIVKKLTLDGKAIEDRGLERFTIDWRTIRRESSVANHGGRRKNPLQLPLRTGVRV